MTIRAIIADDEPLARAAIRTLLKLESDIEVICETEDGLSTVRAVRRHTPDLMFLDIVMPHLTGFEVLEAISTHHFPVVVFVSAFDKYALRAFDFHGVDYLLKPFTRARFTAALNAARAALSRVGELGAQSQLAKMLDAVRKDKDTPPPHRIAVKHRGRVVLVDLNELNWIESSANYIILHLNSGSYMVRATMGQMEALLDPSHFVRIHRGTIVRVSQISGMTPQGHSDFDVVLQDGATLRLSRNYRSNLFSRLPPKREPERQR